MQIAASHYHSYGYALLFFVWIPLQSGVYE